MKMIAGVDVGKHHLDAYLPPEQWQRFERTDEGIAALIDWLRRGGAEQVAFDASGGYERPLMEALHAAKMPANLVHPLYAKRYAQSLGRAAKTDRLDAKTLSEFTRERGLPPTPPKDPEIKELEALWGRRRQLVDERVREKNRLEKKPSKVVAESCEAMIAHLDAEIERLEAAAREVVRTSPALSAQVELYKSVKCVADGCAFTLLTELPELGKGDHRAIASLVGLAPHPRDSGTKQGKRFIGGGRGAVRVALYMSAMSASQYNQQMKPFYDRLVARGKPRKVAQVAVARKLLLQLHAIAKRGTPWVENYTPAG